MDKHIQILLIEDDLGQAQRVKKFLLNDSQQKFDVCHATSLYEGLEYLSHKNIDLILLDLTLPDGHGISLIRKVYALTETLPLLVMTDVDDINLGIQVIEAGAQDYLVKHYMSSRSFSRVIRYSIERKRVELVRLKQQGQYPPFSEDNDDQIQIKEDVISSLKDPQTYGNLLWENETRFRQFISSITDHIYVTQVTPDGQLVNLYLSPNIEQLTGYPQEKFRDDWSFWPTKVIYPMDQALAQEQANHLASGQDHEVEYRLIRQDGEIIWVRDSGRVDIEEEMKIVYGVVSDITERKQAELVKEKLTQELQNINQTLDERVRAKTAELQAILDAVGEGVVVTDLTGEIRYINPALIRMTGYTEAEIRNQIAKLWQNETKNSMFHAQMWQTIMAGQTWRGELSIKHKDGSFYDILLSLTPIFGPDGQIQGVVGVQSDITPLKEMDRIKSEFLSTAAHELRTPLTSVQGFSEILLTRDNMSKEQQTRYLTFINEQASVLANIINDLLDLAKLETKQGFDLSLTELDPLTIVKPAIFGFQENYPDHVYKIDDSAVWTSIKGDQAKLAQLFKNLISNATKYSPNGGEIIVDAEIQPDYHLLHITLTDNGLGMTDDQLHRVFEKFYRADASNTAIGGTGLGMSISRLIVELHGGKIWLESEYGVGTKVHLLFPLLDRPQYILIIEDDPELMEMEQTLLHMEGFSTLSAEDVPQGMDLALNCAPNLILLDLNLPGVSGFTALEQLKESHLTENIPVVITSAMDSHENIEQAMDLGATDYLVKPYSVEDLLLRINRALNQNATHLNNLGTRWITT